MSSAEKKQETTLIYSGHFRQKKQEPNLSHGGKIMESVSRKTHDVPLNAKSSSSVCQYQ